MIVDVVAVERELDRIQRELTHTEVRTSLLNLVVFSPDAEKAMADDALNYLLGKRAARVIHIVDAGEGESRLDVSARCFVDAERKSVCFQEIVITSGADGAGGAPGSWVPLLVRDIPTYVIWLDSICGRFGLLTHAAEQADKVLIDAELSVARGDDPDELLRVLRAMTVEAAVPVSDFAFRRLRVVQRLVAAAFDDPDRVPLLEEISEVTLRIRSTLAGRLLSLWLADRLRWTLSDGVYRDARGREVRISVTESSDCIFDLRLAMHHGDPVHIVSQLTGCADVDYSDEGGAHPVVAVPGNGELLLEEVDAVASDRLYYLALKKLASAPLTDAT